MIALSFIGVGLYILYVWFVWSNRFDKKKKGFDIEVEDNFLEKLHDERQELVATVIGAAFFAFGGEGILDSVCDGFNYFLGSSAHDFCTSIQVNNEEIFYVIGGACFGSIALFIIKMLKRKADKKLKDI